MNVKFPEKLKFLFVPARYKVAYGGRGGAKSWGFARALVLRAAERPTRILCTREYQNSIQESVHRLLSDQIESMGLARLFDIQQTVLRACNGSEFIFAGLRNNPTKIKSTEGIDICWVEEAEKVSNKSWETLIPTVRNPDSEIWVSFNPHEESDPTYKRFVVDTPPHSIVQKINWRDNPWFPDELRREKDYLARVDPEAYAHIWEGECRKQSAAQVMYGKYSIQGFEPGKEWGCPYFGADWGFSVDPTTLVKMWIYNRRLYIEHEAYGVGVEIDQIPEMFSRVPDSRLHVIRGDCSRPETISYLQRNGYPRIMGAAKWSGSIEDGIAFLRSFEEIIIHPRCTHVAEEARLYSYKIDRLTDNILPDIVDAHNHCWDAIRYALEPIIKSSGRGLLSFYSDMAAQAEADRQQAIGDR